MSTPSSETRESPRRPRWPFILIGLLVVLIVGGLLFVFIPGLGSFFSQGGLSPAGGHCNQPCDPNAPSCDPGLSCVTEPDGGYVCFGGTDLTGETCGGGITPTVQTYASGCNQRCDPTGSTCDPGLSCEREPDGGYVCWGGTDASGETCGQPPRPTGGVCNSPCDPLNPANPACDPGLSCVTEPDGGFVCWGGTDSANETCGQSSGGEPQGANGVCGAFCDLNASTCDAGLSCVPEPDGEFVCWGGTDSVGTLCGQPPATGGLCNAPCSPTANTCDPGLSCVMEPDGGYVCWDGTDSAGEVCGNGASQPTGDGTCNQPCSPTASNCNPGLSCVTEPDGGYVCWGGTDSTGQNCGPNQPSQTQPPASNACVCNNRDYVCTKPDGSTTVSYNAVECDGSGVCECREPNKTWACPDGTYAEFNPQCGVGGGTTPVGPTCTCVKADPQCNPISSVCKYVCKEDPGKSCTP